jgi:hypothetical protein
VTFIIDAAIRLTKNLNLQSGQDLIFSPKGSIQLDGGIQLRLNSKLQANFNQGIFIFGHGENWVSGNVLNAISVKWFGALGNGSSNDTVAFQKASYLINSSGGGTLRVPAGTYVIGLQVLTGSLGKGASYAQQSVISISNNTKETVIEGENSTVLKFADKMRFGTFDPATGAAYFHSMPFVNPDYAASPGAAIQLISNKKVTVRNLEINGNLQNYIVGGQYGDTGYQVFAHGIVAYNNQDLTLDTIYTHHNGTDGVMLGYNLPGFGVNDPPHPHFLSSVTSEYNGRQGLSWVGGNSLTVTHSKFNHTGKARTVLGTPISSAPGAGLDIEAEDSIIRGGYFEDVEFIDNAGPGITADSGDGGYTTFKNIVAWGTTSWSLWLRKPRIVLEDSKIYGSAVNFYTDSLHPENAVKVIRTSFEDKDYNGEPAYNGGYLVITDGAAGGLLFDGCTFIAHRQKLAFLNARDSGGFLIQDSNFIQANSELPDKDFVAVFRNGSLNKVSYSSLVSLAPASNWYIESSPSPHLSSVNVYGPYLRWSNPNSGPFGRIEDN